jgi:DNA invertase Pin-like site-specific DNA recombinase
VVETYIDQSKSATDRTKKRPAYDRMVADYLDGAFDAIICYDLDRLTRQPRQLEDWIDAAELRGLALVTANGDADLSTDGGRMYAVNGDVIADEAEAVHIPVAQFHCSARIEPALRDM